MSSQLPQYTLRYKLEQFRLPAMLEFFKKHEGKDYDKKIGIEQVNTQYGLYLYGQITLIEEILNKEI
tara:strand:+ start:911 stop:1111 length:201 start_codon:yes stop_codon:yes gene_type:complete